jgi:hypothetical protein
MSLSETLARLRERMRHSKKIVNDQPGPLQQPARSELAGQLTAAQTGIADATILINNAGAANTGGMSTTLPGIATDGETMAALAYTESNQPSPDNNIIGDLIKTIDWQIDAVNGYRQKAGIT